MISYNLAEKLREAGFPNIEIRGGDGKLPCGADSCFHNHDRIPTLSELIEACGDGFQSLGRAMPARIGYMNSVENGYDASTKIQWWAHAGLGAPSLPTTEYDSSGDTPEEAVANLYLKLNAK